MENMTNFQDYREQIDEDDVSQYTYYNSLRKVIAVNYIVLDLEWNQCPYGKKKEDPKLPFEIIEIGAVKLDASFRNVGTFHETIRPVLYRRLHYMTRSVIHMTENDFAGNNKNEITGGLTMEKILKVEGMMCAHCQKHVHDALAKMDGVTAVDVNLEAKTATVQETRDIPVAEFEKVIADAGYELVK